LEWTPVFDSLEWLDSVYRSLMSVLVVVLGFLCYRLTKRVKRIELVLFSMVSMAWVTLQSLSLLLGEDRYFRLLLSDQEFVVVLVGITLSLFFLVFVLRIISLGFQGGRLWLEKP